MGDSIVFFIVSAGLIIMGLYFIFGSKSRNSIRKSDRVMVEAVIADHTTERSSCGGDHPGHTAEVSTYPIYEYTVNGKNYRSEGSVGITVFTKEKYKVGARETVWIDPARPDRVYTHGERNATAVIGGILIAFGLAALLFSF